MHGLHTVALVDDIEVLVIALNSWNLIFLLEIMRTNLPRSGSKPLLAEVYTAKKQALAWCIYLKLLYQFTFLWHIGFPKLE